MNICEICSYRDGNVVRRVGFTKNGLKEYLVYEQTAHRPNPMDDKVVEWNMPFSRLYGNREEARSSFAGRVALLAYEEGNVQFNEPVLAYVVSSLGRKVK